MKSPVPNAQSDESGNAPYYTPEEIKKIANSETFSFPEGLSEFECIVIVAGHRLYRAIPESQLRKFLPHCKLIIDNLEETWKNFNWNSTGIKYHVAGTSKALTVLLAKGA